MLTMIGGNGENKWFRKIRNQRFEFFIHKNQHNFINFTHTKNPRKITKLIEKLPNDEWNTIRNGVENTLQLDKNPLKCQDGFLTKNKKIRWPILCSKFQNSYPTHTTANGVRCKPTLGASFLKCKNNMMKKRSSVVPWSQGQCKTICFYF